MRIKNWNNFQHFKDRRPPWIKLHREILDQRDINLISDCSFRVLIGLWLLASEDCEMQGNLPSIDDISFRLRIDKPKINKALKELEPFLIQDDIKVISDRYHDDRPETETETETETEAKTELEKSRNNLDYSSWPSLPNDQLLADWLRSKKKAGGSVSQSAINTVGKELHKAIAGGYSVEYCIELAESSGWRGFKAEWVAKDKKGGNLSIQERAERAAAARGYGDGAI